VTFVSRRLSLKKWHFCEFICQGTQMWKQLLLHQIKQECQMALGKAQDFLYKEVSKDLGMGTDALGNMGSEAHSVFSLACSSVFSFSKGKGK
jgi:hypothetical protein